MGTIEQKAHSKASRDYLQHVVLGTVAGIGLVGFAMVAPNALQALKMFGFKPHKRQAQTINRTRNRLIEKGYLKRNARGFLSITEQGKLYLHKQTLLAQQKDTPRKWDKKWRLLIFDIPENKKGLRNKVRITLASIGFIKLQNSVWVYPYACEDLIALLKSDFKIGKDLLYIIAYEIENDKELRKHFNLPSL